MDEFDFGIFFGNPRGKQKVASRQGKDYYEILGVSHDADERAIKKAYRKGAVKWHPDKQSGKTENERKAAEEKFEEICEAYGVLSDFEKRFVFDQYYEEALKAGEPPPSDVAPPPPPSDELQPSLVVVDTITAILSIWKTYIGFKQIPVSTWQRKRDLLIVKAIAITCNLTFISVVAAGLNRAFKINASRIVSVI